MDSRKAFVNMMLLDGTENMSPESGLAVLVEGEEIDSIVTVAQIPLDWEIIDLKGQYMLPGLIDMDFKLSPDGNTEGLLGKMRCQDNAKQALLSGITTVRVTDCPDSVVSHIRTKIDCGKCLGPRIITANASEVSSTERGESMAEAVSPQFALHAATELNAEAAGIGELTGTIEPGKSADFMVVEKNPLRDLSVLKDPKMIVFRGNIIKHPRPKKPGEAERILNRF